MDGDTDIVATSPVSTQSTGGVGIRGPYLPPLPSIPGIAVPSSSIDSLPATASSSAQVLGSQRARRTNRNSQSTRSVSLENWVVSQTGSTNQAGAPEGRQSPRQDVIPVQDNSDNDIIIESEGEVEVVTINENSDNDSVVELHSGASDDVSSYSNDGPGLYNDEVIYQGSVIDSDYSRSSYNLSEYSRNSFNQSENTRSSFNQSENTRSSFNQSDNTRDTINGSEYTISSGNASENTNLSTGSGRSATGPDSNSETRNFGEISNMNASEGPSETSSGPVQSTSADTSSSVQSTSVLVESTSVPETSTSVQGTSASLTVSSTDVPGTSTSVPSEQGTSTSVISSTSVTDVSASVPSASVNVILGTPVPDASTFVQVSTTDQGAVGSANPSSLVTRIADQHNDSLSEFRSPKRKRVASPEKTEKKLTDTVEDEEEGESCPICFEPWTTSGNHRLCSLRCGHLFGQSCIEKWLKGQGGKCPHCNAKAKRQDIRVLFAKTIKALDTSERDRALKDLEKEKELRRKVEMETAQLRLQYQLSVEDTNKLRLELERLKSQMRKSGQTPITGNAGQMKPEPSLQGSQLSGQFVLEKTIKIWEGGNCRVMAYSNSLATLVVTQPSSSQLFPGFGIKKISTLDFKTSQYLTIHSKAIRDMAFHQNVEDGILLSCGLDKKVKMTSLISNAVVQTYDTPMPGWSCAWNAGDCNYFYTGLQNGLVLQFDVRNTGEPVQEFNKEGSRSPVASMVYVTPNQQTDFRSGGLLIGQLDRVSFLENSTQGEKIHILPLEGNLTSLNVDQETRHLLASYRPTSKHPTIRHQLCELTSTNISTDPTVINNVCSCNIVHTFHGGRKQTVLTKTLIQKHPSDLNRLLVCGGDETSNSVHTWDAGTGQLTQKLFADGMVVDLCKFRINNQHFLAALTDKQCKIFKWK